MPDAESVAPYRRAMTLLNELLMFGEHHWSCKGEGPMKKGCTCGYTELEERCDNEVEHWQTKVCAHSDDVRDLDDGAYCFSCKSWVDTALLTARIDGDR